MTTPTPTPTLLLVDDDDRLRERLARAFVDRGFHVLQAADHARGIELARDHKIDRAVVDLRMAGAHGLKVLQDLIALDPEIDVVICTGYGSIATAVEAMRLGARDYITKPANADQILAAFDKEPEPTGGAIDFEIPSLAKLEREHIERVLRECNGNVTKAAKALGMHRRTLQYKLAKFPVSR